MKKLAVKTIEYTKSLHKSRVRYFGVHMRKTQSIINLR
jgi:hypothetical protein